MEKIIRNYQEALDVRNELAPKQTDGWHFLYRGHASMRFELLSMIGRKQPINGDCINSERGCLNDFKALVAEENWQQFKVKSYNDDMFYMSIGRHLGLDCRLLDWTAKLETALYFAASDNKCMEEDGCLWVMCYPNSIDDSGAKIDPFNVNEIKLVKENFWLENDLPISILPLGIARRFSQNGFFTITPTYQLPMPLNELSFGDVIFISYRITPNAKAEILDYLHGYDFFLQLSTPSRLRDVIRAINASYFI